MKNARYEKLIEAFGGTGQYVTDPQSLAKAVTDALASRKPALINSIIHPRAGTESGHLQNLNPHRRRQQEVEETADRSGNREGQV
jgi:oxalyl-CoA decarboxylase